MIFVVTFPSKFSLSIIINANIIPIGQAEKEPRSVWRTWSSKRLLRRQWSEDEIIIGKEKILDLTGTLHRHRRILQTN